VADRLRLALVGAGRRGSAHLATVRCLPDLFDLVAVCDVSEGAAQAAAAKAECAAFTDLRECIDRNPLDAVVIVTPAENHHIAATIAAQRGVNMLIETPLATTRAMMDVIANVTAKAGVKVEIAENYSRRPMEQLNQAAIRAGLIGPLLHLSVFNAPANEECVYHTMSLLRALHRAITEGTAPEYSVAQARRSQELAITIAESARLGQPMPAHLEAETGWERDTHAATAARWGMDPLDDVDRVLERALGKRG
jgi:predicted dehydrogenase